MYHLVARVHEGKRIFKCWAEGLLLWRMIAARVPLRALIIMSTHLHVIVRSPRERELLGRVLVGFAQARNARRGESGSLWRAGVGIEHLSTEQHVQRMVRYQHLNPCRARMVDDPLEWPLSTHRDACGLAFRPVIKALRDTEGYHAWVSKDRSCDPDGTSLPQVDGASTSAPTLDEVAAATSALARATESEVRGRTGARAHFVRAARALECASDAEIGDYCGLSLRSVQRISAEPDREVALIQRVLGDPRFSRLHDGEIRWNLDVR